MPSQSRGGETLRLHRGSKIGPWFHWGSKVEPSRFGHCHGDRRFRVNSAWRLDTRHLTAPRALRARARSHRGARRGHARRPSMSPRDGRSRRRVAAPPGSGSSGIRSRRQPARSGTSTSAPRCSSGSSRMIQPPGPPRPRSERGRGARVARGWARMGVENTVQDLADDVGRQPLEIRVGCRCGARFGAIARVYHGWDARPAARPSRPLPQELAPGHAAGLRVPLDSLSARRRLAGGPSAGLRRRRRR